MKTSILVVENDPKERAVLRAYLEHQGYVTQGMDFRPKNAPLAEVPDLILLGLPPMHARIADYARWIAEWRHLPIIVLSFRDDIEAKISLLDAGADDFWVRLQPRDELSARVRAVLRRQSQLGTNGTSNRVMVGEFLLDLDGKRGFVEGRDLRLTRTELLVLAELVRKMDRVCSHNELLSRVWGGEYFDANHYLHVYVGRIRKKLGATYSSLLETVSGLGYILHSTLPHHTKRRDLLKSAELSMRSMPEAVV